MDCYYTYSVPEVNTTDIVATNNPNEAAQLIEKGYTLFTVPQMFGSDNGIITLYRMADYKPVKNGMAVLEQYKQESGLYISGGSKSCDQVNDNH